MFHADITFVLALIALATGGFLILFAKIHKDIAAGICSAIGYVVAVLAIIALLFSGYGILRTHTVKHQMMFNMMQRGRIAPYNMGRRHIMRQKMMQRRMVRRYKRQLIKNQMPTQGATKPAVQMQKQPQPMIQSTQPKAVTTTS